MGKHNFPWQVILYIRNNLKYLVVENIITFTLHYYQVPKEENLTEVPILAISLVYIASSYTTAYASWNCRAKTPKKTALRRYENQQNKSDKKTVLLWLQRKNVWWTVHKSHWKQSLVEYRPNLHLSNCGLVKMGFSLVRVTKVETIRGHAVYSCKRLIIWVSSLSWLLLYCLCLSLQLNCDEGWKDHMLIYSFLENLAYLSESSLFRRIMRLIQCTSS